MGQVKAFYQWVVECVFDIGLSNEAILEDIQARWPQQFNKDHQTWVLEQIEAIRDNPDLYQPRSQAYVSFREASDD